MNMNRDQWMSVLRTVMSMVCGLLVGKGILTAEQAATITSNLLIVIPAACAVGVAVWGAINKTDRNKVLAASSVPGTKVVVDPLAAPASVVNTANDPAVPNVESNT